MRQVLQPSHEMSCVEPQIWIAQNNRRNFRRPARRPAFPGSKFGNSSQALDVKIRSTCDHGGVIGAERVVRGEIKNRTMLQKDLAAFGIVKISSINFLADHLS